MADDLSIISRLFVAAPELRFDLDFLRALSKAGILDDEQRQAMRAGRRRAGRIHGQALIRRIVTVAPETLDVDTVGILRKYKLISENNGRRLLSAARAAGNLKTGGRALSDSTVLARLSRSAGSAISSDSVELMQMLGRIDAKRASDLRAGLAARSRVTAAIKAAASPRNKVITDILFATMPNLLDRETIRAFVQTGVLSARQATMLNGIVDMGPNAWRSFQGAGRVKGLAQRGLMVSNGVFTDEFVRALTKAKVLSAEDARLLRPAVEVVDKVTDRLSDMHGAKGPKFRVIPGESPIVTFAKRTRATDRDILRLLAQASREAGREAAALTAKNGVGAATRAAQLRVQSRALHASMREMWEKVGYLTIFGEREAALAAVDSMNFLTGAIWSDESAAAQRMIVRQARAGVDSFISRQENVVRLSERVYKNVDLYAGRVDQRVNLGLLQGKSAKEIAADVARYIRPDVPGGVSYSAMRLARTEINNAFHLTSIRYTREQPWVEGYKWHLSGSHPHADICNEYAGEDHDDMGEGVYKKENVPNKPHPHCFCYVTPETVDPDEFVDNYVDGKYDGYLRQAERNGVFGEGFSTFDASLL